MENKSPDGDRGRMDAQQPQPEPAETAAASQWPLGDIESELQDLRAAAGLLLHVAASPHQIEDEELICIATQIFRRHARLEALWKQVWEEQRREDEAHAAALAAAKARTAPPGSQADAERAGALWGVLTTTANVVLEAARSAMPEGARALLGEAGAQPPAESGRA